MADDRQNNKNSALSTAANAASFAKGAMKTGKTIAGATKGAAAGPYGMLAAGLWENRNLVGKIIAGACVLFMLPVLFLAMLPSLIFGTDGMDTASKDTLNNPDVIMENLATTEGSIEAILREKHDALIESILSEADKLGENCEYSITDEFADRIIHESSMIISQFCASQNDYKEIKLSKLEKTLRKNLKKVFSYSVNTSTYEKEDETTKATIIVTHYEYVIEYAGSDYFANEVFSLTSEQKQLAEDYALNMQRFLYSNVYQIKPNWSLIAGETGEKAVGYGILMLDTPYSQERRKGQFNCVSDSRRYEKPFIPIVTEYMLLLHKKDALIIPFHFSQDSRFSVTDTDITALTWHHLIRMTLESAGGQMTLVELYAKLQHHPKAKKNKHYKERIRATIYEHRTQYIACGDGSYKLSYQVA